MGYFPPRHPYLFTYKFVDFFLELLLLLGHVMHNHSSMQRCRLRTEEGGFPNFTSEAGSSFIYKVPYPVQDTINYQVTLADGGSPLPHWLLFQPRSNTLTGLALAEECGIYHLTVSGAGVKCAANFYLTIVNKTLTVRQDSPRRPLSCSEGKTSIWADLLLHLNPVTLDVTRRLSLVNNMASFLHRPVDSVYLFSREHALKLRRQNELRVCRRRRPAVRDEVPGDVAELMWPVGCPGADFTPTLEHSVKSGSLAKLLGATILELRILCATNGVQQKIRVKRGLTSTQNDSVRPATLESEAEKLDRSESAVVPVQLGSWSSTTFSLQSNLQALNLQPACPQGLAGSAINSINKHTLLQSLRTQSCISLCSSEMTPGGYVSQTLMQHSIFPTAEADWYLGSSVCMDLTCSQTRPFSRQNPHPDVTVPCVSEVTSDSSPSEYVLTADFYSSLPFYLQPARESTVVNALSTKVPSALLHSLTIYPPLPPTPGIYSVTSTLTHNAIDGAPPATCLTPGPHLNGGSPWTECFRGGRSDSERRPTVSSQDEGLSIFSQDQELTLHNNPSVSHPPWTGEFYDIQSQSSVLKWTQFPTSSNTMQTTQLSADMSLFSYLMTEQGSVTQNMATIQQPSPYSSGLNQAAMSQPNASVDQLVTSGQFQLESSLPTSTFEASSVMSTPALSSEFGLFTGTLQTPTLSDITDETFSAEFQLKSSEFLSLMETSFKSLQPSLQSKPGTGFHTASGREVTFVESQQTGTLTSVTSLSSTLFSAEDPQTLSVHSSVLTYQSFDELTPVKSTHERMSFMLSLTQTLMQTPQTEEFQNIHSSHVFSSPETAGFIYPHAASTQTDQTMSPLSQLSTSKNNIMSQSGDYPGPTAPSTAQEPYITTSAYLMQSLGPSFPVCDQGKVHISGCSSFIYSTEKLRHTVDDSYLPPTENLTSFTSQFLRFDSSGRVVPTVTSVDYVSFLFTNVYKYSSFSILTHTPSLDVDLSTPGGQSSARPLRSSASAPESLNFPPIALQTLPFLVATVGFPFLYSVPPETFLDPEDGTADALSLRIHLKQGPPLSVGLWLALDGLELHGIPLELDLQFAPQHLLLEARDRQGQSASLPFTVDLKRRSVEPCHFFTLTAQRSLHSVLHHRHLVELMLNKLSLFFDSSGSNRHLSLVSIMPGSTVVSWFNRTLCGTARLRRTQCPVEETHDMWLRMKSDGSVKPEFKAAMLPEFPIIKVGPVTYRHDCFSTSGSSTPADHTDINPSSSTNTSQCLSPSLTVAPTSQQTNSSPWLVGLLSALLVIGILILITIVVAATLHLRKNRKWSELMALWPANHWPTVNPKDLLWAIGPRRPPLFQPEPLPPPLKLWIDPKPQDRSPPSVEGDSALEPRPPRYDPQ